MNKSISKGAHTTHGRLRGTLIISSGEKLNHLKKLTQQYQGENKTYEDESQNEIERNNETIKKLKTSIYDMRVAKTAPFTNNEYLMRQALTDHHPGSNIYREKEPKDINGAMDNKLCDMKNKLNKLRNARRSKTKQLKHLQERFNEAVSDYVRLELEGPAGDSRCLSLENHISDTQKKSMEGTMLHDTYSRIRDQLFIENSANESAFQAINMMLQQHENELAHCRNACAEAIERKNHANAETFRTEYDLHDQRRERHLTEGSFRKSKDEQTHELNELWRKIQNFFAMQDTMPMGHALSGISRIGIISVGAQTPSETLAELEDEFAVLGGITGCQYYEEVVEQFENQVATYQHLTSIVKGLEVKKSTCLGDLQDLQNVKASQTFKTDSAEDIELRIASGDCSDIKAKAEEHRWSLVAARNHVTQRLARLRELLEYLVDIFVKYKLIKQPAAHDPGDTERHMVSTLAAALEGARTLMAEVGSRDLLKEQRAAATALFVMTRSEEKMQKPRLPLERDEKEDALAGTFDGGETTGDDSRVPTRATIKRQAQTLLLAKTKHGGMRRKKS